MPAGGAMHLRSANSVRLSVPAAKGEAPTPSRDEDSSPSPPPSPPALAVPPARNKRGMYMTVVCQSMERHYGQYSMCRARSMSVVYSRCGSLIIDVDHRCRPSIVDADRRSSMSKIDVDVDHPSLLSKININVDHRCDR